MYQRFPQQRLLLEISFDGSAFCGWQIQPDKISVQEVIQNILRRLYSDNTISLLGSGRTDSGVHAVGFVATFLAPAGSTLTPVKLISALNSLLPNTIKVRNVEIADEDFHCRFDASGKAYSYILNLETQDPFSYKYSWQQRVELDKIRSAANILIGTHDYSSFVVERKKYENAIRTIYGIDFYIYGKFCCITFKGNGFLYKMLRCIVGALVAVGRGQITEKQFEEIFQAKDRCKAPSTAPAHALFLMKVFYDMADLEKYEMTQLPFVVL